MGPPDFELWHKTAAERLIAKKYRLTDRVTFEGTEFRKVAHKSGFQLSKCGNLETFFVFDEVANTDPASLKLFSANAFKCARASKSSPLPCGLFEALVCYAVAIVDRLDEATSASIRVTAPTKHWAAFEVPVVYEKSRGSLCYFEQTPMWGALYYKGFRKQIEEFLGAGPAS